jgi:hypothetical protein
MPIYNVSLATKCRLDLGTYITTPSMSTSPLLRMRAGGINAWLPLPMSAHVQAFLYQRGWPYTL